MQYDGDAQSCSCSSCDGSQAHRTADEGVSDAVESESAHGLSSPLPEPMSGSEDCKADSWFALESDDPEACARLLLHPHDFTADTVPCDFFSFACASAAVS